MKKNNSDFQTGFLSEAGILSANKGYFGFLEGDEVACWVIAEGIDTCEEKESAKLAVEQILADFANKPVMSKSRINQYLMNAHERLKDESKNVRLKVSLVMVVSDYSKMIWAVTGNLRLYHFRKGVFNFRSKDQTIAQLMIDSGNLTEEEANRREERNNIISFLGGSSELKPAISEAFRLLDDDVMLLCNCGFWEHFTNEEIAAVLETTCDPDHFIKKLQETLLEKASQRVKNYTLAAIFAKRVIAKNAPAIQPLGQNLLKDNNVVQKLLTLLKKVEKQAAGHASADYLKLAQKIALVLVPVILITASVNLVNKKVEAIKLQKERAHQKQVELLQIKSIIRYEANGDRFVTTAQYLQAAKEYETALKVSSIAKVPHRKLIISQKNEITKQIITADKYVASGNFEEALQLYNSAAQKIATLNYDPSGLQARINRTKSIIDMFNLVKTGDDEFSRQNLVVAKEKYQLALRIAEQLSWENLKVELNNKIGKVDHTIEALARQRAAEEQERRKQREQLAQKVATDRKIAKAKSLERSGDAKYAVGEYKEASEFYQMAKNVYDNLGLQQEAASVNGKIKKSKLKQRFRFF